METAHSRLLSVESEKAVPFMTGPSSAVRTALLALVVFVVSYLVDMLADTTIFTSHGIWLIGLTNGLLVAVMLLMARRTWPVLIAARIAAQVAHDLQFGFTLRATGLFALGATIQILIIGLGLRYSFEGVPQLSSLKALGKYCLFAAFLYSIAWFTTLGVLLCLFVDQVSAAQSEAENVLLVFNGLASRHDGQEIVAVLESAVRANTHLQTNFYVTYLDYKQVEDRSYSDSLAETLRNEYKAIKLDVVIAAGVPETRFITEYRDKIFPEVPVVFSMVSASEFEDLKMLPGMTGVTLPLGIGGTIDLALRLHPDTKAIAVIQDTSGITERDWLAVTRSELRRYENKVREIDIIGPPSGQMLEKVAALPPHTVVLFQLAPQISTEPTVAAYDILTAAARRLPTYSAWDSLCFNYGCIGGAHHDWRKAYQATGELTGRVLNGEHPDAIPVVHETHLQVQVDWQALQRWHIPESALPPGTVILYREPTFWERDRKYILSAIALLLGQALLIAGLLWQRDRKRKAEAVLQESEKRFRGQLISAQEQERIRIARELHDDVCQRLAMLSLKIEKAAKHDGNGQLAVAQQLEQIWQQCSSLAGDVQALSHELHPSILDNLGLGTAVKSYCREVAQHNGVVVELSSGNLPSALPQDVSLSVFRVLQEALRNAVKYSGQKHVKVCLQENSGQLELEVSDQGVGFDVTNTRKSGGLGLVSMAERIYQVNGTLSIDSQPNAGTRIRARVPLAAPSASAN